MSLDKQICFDWGALHIFFSTCYSTIYKNILLLQKVLQDVQTFEHLKFWVNNGIARRNIKYPAAKLNFNNYSITQW